MMAAGSDLKIMITAGEASGDVLGARLMQALKAQSGRTIQFIGVGGAQMQAEGLESIFPMRDLSVMGILEVLPRVNLILKRINQTVALALKEKPDLIITIDSPDFSFRVADRMKQAGVTAPKIHYVAPTVWAWRPERAAKVASLYDRVMCLYPFEPPYFEAVGLRAAFVGHSVLESGYERADGAALRASLNIPEDAPVLGVLFGSRMGELNRIGPALRTALIAASRKTEGAHILAPTLPHLRGQVCNLLQGLRSEVHIVTEPQRKWDCFDAMDMALAASGTVGLELSVADVPHMIAYKMHPLTWQIVRRKVSVPYAHLANILLDRPAVPEFIQSDLFSEHMTQTAVSLLTDDDLRAQQRAAFAEVRSLLVGAGGDKPSVQAARFALDSI